MELLASLLLKVLVYWIDVRRLHALPLSRVHGCLRPLPNHLLVCLGSIGYEPSRMIKDHLLLLWREWRRLWLAALLDLHLALMLLLLLHVHLELCIWRYVLPHYVIPHTHRYLLWLLLPLHW